jgi:hypothetical protein
MEKDRGIEYEPGRFTAGPSDEEIIRAMQDAIICEEDRIYGPITLVPDGPYGGYGGCPSKPSRQSPTLDARLIFAAIRAYEKAKRGG